MIELIVTALKLVSMILGQWFKFSDEKRAKAKELMKEVKDAKDISSITSMLDRINRL